MHSKTFQPINPKTLFESKPILDVYHSPHATAIGSSQVFNKKITLEGCHIVLSEYLKGLSVTLESDFKTYGHGGKKGETVTAETFFDVKVHPKIDTMFSQTNTEKLSLETSAAIYMLVNRMSQFKGHQYAKYRAAKVENFSRRFVESPKEIVNSVINLAPAWINNQSVERLIAAIDFLLVLAEPSEFSRVRMGSSGVRMKDWVAALDAKNLMKMTCSSNLDRALGYLYVPDVVEKFNQNINLMNELNQLLSLEHYMSCWCPPGFCLPTSVKINKELHYFTGILGAGLRNDRALKIRHISPETNVDMIETMALWAIWIFGHSVRGDCPVVPNDMLEFYQKYLEESSKPTADPMTDFNILDNSSEFYKVNMLKRANGTDVPKKVYEYAIKELEVISLRKEKIRNGTIAYHVMHNLLPIWKAHLEHASV